MAEVMLLVEQKRAVERELMELKSQLEKSGFSSLSQMRCSCSLTEQAQNAVLIGNKAKNNNMLKHCGTS